MDSRTFYYARVSSKDQNLERQIEAFYADGAREHDIITEKASGKTMDRPAYQAMKNHMLREGDTLVVKSLDRLGRNKEQIKDELDYYKKHGIRVRILDLPTSNIKVPEGQEWIVEMVTNILIEVLSSQAEQERLTTRKRQAEGIAIAKAQGKYKGGQPKEYDPEVLDRVLEEYQHGEISKAEIARQLHVSRPTVYRVLARHHLS